MAGQHVWLMIFSLSAALVSSQEPPSISTSSASGGPDLCSTLQQIANNSNDLCSTTDMCTRIQCGVDGATMNFGVDPCQTPPALLVFTEIADTTVLDDSFSSSEERPVDVSGFNILTLNITVLQTPSMDNIIVEVDLITLIGNEITVIPRTSIPVVRDQCGISTFPTTTRATTPSVTNAPPNSGPTCEALDGIASNSQSQCRTTQICTELDCDFTVIRNIITIQPCTNPPSVRVRSIDSDGDTTFDEVFSETRTQDFGPVTAIVTVRHVPSPDSIIFGMAIDIEGSRAVIIPDTDIPIDRSHCSMLPSVPTPMSTEPPTSLPVTTTCDALQEISSNVPQSCTTDAPCTSVICNLNQGIDIFNLTFTLTVVSCTTPPAIAIGINFDDMEIFNDTLTESRLEDVTFGSVSIVQLDVRVDVSPDLDAITVEVNIVNGDSMIPLIPETRIPINRCSCPNINCPLTLPPTGGITDTTSGGTTSGGTTSGGTGTSTSSTGTTNTPSVNFNTGDQVGGGEGGDDEVSVGLIVPLVIVSILLVIVITILILVLILYFNKKKVPTSDSVALSQVKENEYDDSGKEIA